LLKKDVENLQWLFYEVSPYFLILKTDINPQLMTKHVLLGIVFSLFFIVVSAQNTDLNKADRYYENGEFSVAQNYYVSALSNSETKDVLLYKIANCSRNLGNRDAVYWYSLLLDNYKNSSYYQRSKADLSYLYFSEKKYSDCIKLFSEVTDVLLKTDEYNFKFAYSLFLSERLDDAKYYFSKVETGKYKSLSQYYYAHITYIQKLYNISLSVFKLLEDDKMFSRIVPYYITQIYYTLEKYSEVINYAVPMLENVISSRELEMNRIVSESYYYLNDFENSKIYFNRYMNFKEEVSALDYFQLGQIHVCLENYDEAILNLEKVGDIEDSLMQYTSYYLGRSYLKLGRDNFALNAFKKASEIDFDIELKEESLYNYFKLSYELDLPYSNLTYVTDQLNEFQLSKYKQEIKRLMINMFQSTNQYQQAFDFLKNNHLPKKEQKETLQRLAYYIGVQHYNNANYTNALTKFEFASKYPENKEIDVMCLYWLGDCYYQLRDYKMSISYYQEYLETPSNSLIEKIAIAKYNLAYSYFQSAQYSSAIQEFRKSINSDLDLDRMHDAKMRLADSYYMISDFENAAYYYHKSSMDIHKMEGSHFDIDYSIYQESKCYGLISDYKSQEKCLKGIVENEKESAYLERSLIDLATLYKNQNRINEALRYYNQILDVSENEEILSMVYLNKGLIDFNQGEIEGSIINLKKVVEDFPKTSSFSGAKIGLKDAFVSKGSVNEYLSYINKIPQLDISISAKDSLTYQVAYNNFKKQDYKKSKLQFHDYISDFGTDAIFDKQSHYYYAESCWNTEDTTLAVEASKSVLDFGVSVYYEPSLVKICRYSYDKKDVMSSNKYYQLLDSVASSNGLKRESIIRLMFGFENTDSELAVRYANRVLQSEKLNNRLIARSKIIIAREDYKNGNFARSSDLCDEIVGLTKNRDGSEAMYMKSYFSFLNDDYVKTEEMVFQLSEEYSSNHWIAKGFVLLSDVYIKQDNNFQAKATLESIIENHDGEDVVNEAKLKWEQIVEKELLKQNNEIEEEVVITIGDSLDYEIIYSELQIEEEF
tara:strand:+ start:3482 stop:6631 length:3150 start_codon:yes stop_codon:yes gene_type:complete